jgi:hypothetical protein
MCLFYPRKSFISNYVIFCMKKEIFTLLILLFGIILISNVSASFACGNINDSSKLAGSWIEAQVYYNEKPSDITTCKTSPENKFCCDLQSIEGVTWESGKLVSAEVFLPELGYVAGPKQLTISGEGYDVFPDMQLKKVITFNQEPDRILLNKSKIILDLSLHENYNNLRYSLNNNPETTVCEECTEKIFSIDLEKGKNNLTLIAYNKESGKEIYEMLNFYVLDYLYFQDSFDCEKCKTREDKIYIPSKEEVNLTLSINSSHEFSGLVNIYFPEGWVVDEDYFPEDFSLTHGLVEWSVENESSNPITTIPMTSSGTFLKRKDVFRYEIPNSRIFKETKVMVYSLIRVFPFYRYERYSDYLYFEDSLDERVSETEPLILDVDKEIFEVIAIFPTQEFTDAHAYITHRERNFLNRKSIRFNLFTTIPNRKIDHLLFRFKVPKEKEFSFSGYKKDLPYSIYQQDSEYNYYEIEVEKKTSFSIKIR